MRNSILLLFVFFLISCTRSKENDCVDYSIVIHSIKQDYDKEKRVNRIKYSRDSLYIFFGEFFTDKTIDILINNNFEKKLTNIETDIITGLTCVESFGRRNKINSIGIRINDGRLGFVEFCTSPNFLIVSFKDNTLIVQQLNYTPRFD